MAPDTPDTIRRQYADSRNLDARSTLHQRFSTARQSWTEWLFDHLDLPEACRILELGAGPGHLWKANAPRVRQGWEILVSDVSEGMLEQARRNLHGLPNVRVCRLDAGAIALPDGCVDVVIANHMLYHMANLPAALAEIARVLAPGGLLRASTVGDGHMRQLKDLLAELDPPIPYAPGIKIAPFTLQTAATALEGLFERVERIDFEDELRVTEVEPIIDYYQSLGEATAAALAGRLDDLRRRIAARIARDGAFRIAKETGIIRAVRR